VSFGGQTVGFVTVTDIGTPGYLGIKQKTRSVTLVSGVHFRPFSTTEAPDAETDVATEVWKLTAPPVAAVLAAESTGELVYDGTDNPTYDPDDVSNVFQIQGPVQPKQDLAELHHVTVMCRRQHG